MLNDIINRSLASANIPSRLQPSGLYRADGNRPDDVTIRPWSKGKFLVWDATHVDAFRTSHNDASAREVGGAASLNEREKARKHAQASPSIYVYFALIEQQARPVYLV